MSFRFGMVKLQQVRNLCLEHVNLEFPLWHGKVATDAKNVGNVNDGCEFPLWHGKVATQLQAGISAAGGNVSALAW